MFVVSKDLITEFVYKLIKAEVHLSTDNLIFTITIIDWLKKKLFTCISIFDQNHELFPFPYLCFHLIVEELFMKFSQCIMATVIVQIQGIKDVSENHKKNGVKLHMYLSSSITFSEWESKTKVLSKSIVHHAICY